MPDIISFGWGEEYAAGADFDLNTLRTLRKVREIDGKHVLSEERNNITVRISQSVAWEKKETENLELSEVKKTLNTYKRWYDEARKEAESLQQELSTTQADLASLADSVGTGGLNNA